MFYREGEVEVVPGRPSLYRTMLRVVWKELLLSALLRVVVLLWEFSQPLLLQCVHTVSSSVTRHVQQLYSAVTSPLWPETFVTDFTWMYFLSSKYLMELNS